jgi:peptidoglycan/LPS O-acetylase OafA/YrhL
VADGFFAISGFLVTRSLQHCHEHMLKVGGTARQAINDFMIRRIARILVPYYFALALVGVIGALVPGALRHDLIASGSALLGFPLFYANYIIPAYELVIPFFLKPYWSISYQEQFYIILVVVYYFVGYKPRRFGAILMTLGLLAAANRLVFALWIWQGQSRWWDYHCALHLSLDQIVWGAMAWFGYDRLGWLWATKRRSIISSVTIVGLLATAVCARSDWNTDVSYAVLTTIKGPLMALFVRMTCALGETWPYWFLRTRFMVRLGQVSYECYLLHIIVFEVLERFKFINDHIFLLVAYPVTFAAGYALSRVLSRPASKWVKESFLRHAKLPALAAGGKF